MATARIGVALKWASRPTIAPLTAMLATILPMMTKTTVDSESEVSRISGSWTLLVVDEIVVVVATGSVVWVFDGSGGSTVVVADGFVISDGQSVWPVVGTGGTTVSGSGSGSGSRCGVVVAGFLVVDVVTIGRGRIKDGNSLKSTFTPFRKRSSCWKSSSPFSNTKNSILPRNSRSNFSPILNRLNDKQKNTIL